MTQPKNITKENDNKIKFLKALKQTYSNIQKSSHLCEISRTQFYNWLKIDKEFYKKVKRIKKQSIKNIKALKEIEAKQYTDNKGIKRFYKHYEGQNNK